ncbi:hypothetical protein DPEC_G00205190 [Dallia pectoralis]|uniref:Uncharacterized protein n=1 Tax=Dallia pectoralis TaxID=75939 RepID=A0ACC2G4I3_DALPE|nr:hypothetical protein DPEC_G00205190 [Dallia pectoralis]
MPMSTTPLPDNHQSHVMDRSLSTSDNKRLSGATTHGPTRPNFQGLLGSSSQTASPPEQPPCSSQSLTDPPEPPLTTSLAQGLSEPSLPAEKTGTPGLGSSNDAVPLVTEVGSGSKKAENDPVFPHQENNLPAQPMEQGEDMSDHHACLGSQSHLSSDLPLVTLDPCPPESTTAEMESPPSHPQSSMLSERDQPDGQRCPNSDQIPSLAQALLELHELLVSNRCGLSPQELGASDRQDADGLDGSLEPTAAPRDPATHPASRPSHLTAFSADKEGCEADPAGGMPPKCDLPGCYSQEPSLKAEPEAKLQEPENLCPDSSRREKTPDGGGLEDATKNRGTVSEVKGGTLSPHQVDLEFREPPEGQQGRGVADGRASAIDNLDTVSLQPESAPQSPLSTARSTSDEDVSPCTSSPQTQASGSHQQVSLSAPPTPFTEQFPFEHIQRILASGFSAREAADALEQAQGSVELALLALLARKITVPN